MFRIFIAAFVAIMISVPSCHCPVDPDQFEHTRQCMGKVVELATSEQCLGQCLAANWV